LIVKGRLGPGGYGGGSLVVRRGIESGELHLAGTVLGIVVLLLISG
jgi:hypothetical protein